MLVSSYVPHQKGIFLADVVFPLIEDKISSLVVSIVSNLICTHARENHSLQNIFINIFVILLYKYIFFIYYHRAF